ncbi:MAG: hypothetical protein JO325_10115 [Solirubrobacterales bacterium]|nr:hypothetical protein [Solirubrobacterales bacterium]
MGSRGLMLCGALTGALLAGCGSSSHKTATTQRAPAPAKPAPGFVGRVLTNNELPGFTGSPTTPESSVVTWVIESGFPADQQASEEKRLTRLGFVQGLSEDLMDGSTPGLSVVEQFRTPLQARAENAYGAAQFPKENAGQGKYTTFAVPGIPGALGYGVIASGGHGGINIGFAKGPYAYAVGEELGAQGSPTASIADLIAAAQHLYRRVSP